ncbi:MAG TPA: glycosyltransferase family A protein [Chlamydiales bacterium]|nr:glycosyltransferase family A protein [Chlamydiales bacterium]
MKKLCIIFLSALFLSFTSPVKRQEKVDLKVSVIVPCVAFHFHHLLPLLKYYANQTIPPDEVVISLSETEKLKEGEIAFLENQFWPFKLIIIPHAKRKSAGMNRNIACREASGDILMLQDADDVPHPQRVEIVKMLFETYEIDHLIHKFCTEISAFRPVKRMDLRKYSTYTAIEDTHNGNIVISSKLKRYLQWEDVKKVDHDIPFNERVYKLFPNTAVLMSPLICYRQPLSAFMHHLQEKQ